MYRRTRLNLTLNGTSFVQSLSRTTGVGEQKLWLHLELGAELGASLVGFLCYLIGGLKGGECMQEVLNKLPMTSIVNRVVAVKNVIARTNIEMLD